MNYLLALWCLSLAMLRQRKMALLFPILCFFTPKGFGLIDVAALPYLSLNRAIVLFMMLSFVLYVMAAGFRIKQTHFPLASAFTILGLSFLASLVSNPDTWASDAVTTFMLFSELFFPCFLIWNFCQSSRDAERALRYIYIAGIVASIYGTVAFATHFNPFLDYMKMTTPTGRVLAADYSGSVRGARAVGMMSNAITYGAFQAMTFLIGIFLLRANRSASRLLWYVLGQLVLFVGIFATGSRTPLVFALFSTLAFVCLARTRHKIVVVQVGVAVCAIASVIGLQYIEKVMDFALSVFSANSAASQSGSSLDMRLGQALIAWNFFTDAPWFGGGVSKTRSILSSGAYPDFYGAESAIFQWAIDMGAFGLFAFVALFTRIFAQARKLPNQSGRAVVVGMTAGYIVFVISTGVLETMQFFLAIVVLMFIAEGRRVSAPGRYHAQERIAHDAISAERAQPLG
ncbi:O-antigen ligase family protein [Paraburkholderia tropica]|uniref:O-Antigen ligase n=1 Tax=Paraburkholderia tropica TaxID=92647 RepID=A0AAQ1GL86_9BURK|nr:MULTISPECIES: O-antigen ligase family protein [Paraburkholderia]SEK09690.1 O-Antigen ligase [Paraburkholderia tropica]